MLFQRIIIPIRIKWVFYLCFLLYLTPSVFSQDTGTGMEDIEFIIERSMPLSIDLEETDSLKLLSEKKKKKKKKNEFYGLKTKRGFTKSGFGENTTIEIFYYLKKWVDPDPYVPEIYWFDFRRKRIRNSGTIEKKYGRILHGPYKKIQGETLLEEGLFYVGTKHGRWITLDRNDILLNKKKYYKGWPKESLVRYYDEERKKLKEVLPVEYGKVQGTYYQFFENGKIAVRGLYENGEKVGTWTEFYENRQRSKRQIQYKPDAYQDHYEPYIVKEWNETGKVIYDSQKTKNRINQ